ncbi:MAG: FISUMP domain-containing protein, partial [Fibrobacterota bacterium]
MKKAILILAVFGIAVFSQLQAENDTNYTLDDLYNRLQSGTAGTPQEYTEPESGPGTPVGIRINEIMDMLPAMNDSAAESGSVLEGEYFWSLDGEEWGQNAGTMPNVGKQNITPGTDDQAISEGYHDGTGSVAGDTGLVEENIRSGSEIFGVNGKSTVVETEGATAQPEDIMAAKTAWVDGEEVTGTLPFHRSGEWLISNDHKYLIDPDGNSYKTVQIGDQLWIVGNLRTTKYADGTPIVHVTDSGEWQEGENPAYCWYNDTADGDFRNKYGAIYNWKVVSRDNPHDIAPEGWRVPRDEDWYELRGFLDPEADGNANITGGKMKTPGTSDWILPNTGATNESGFSGLPG